MALRKRDIDAARYDPEGPAWQVLWDDRVKGLGCRLYPSGRKAFVLAYRMPGSRRKRLLTLGAYGVLTVTQARSEAQRRIGEIARGQDPLGKREEAAQERKRREAATFERFAELYISEHARPHKRSWKADASRLRRRINPAIGKTPLADVTTGDVAALHAAIGRDGKRHEANRCLEIIKAMYNLAIEWGHLPEDHVNPGKRVKRFREKDRDRWVMPEEMPRLLTAIAAERDPYVKAFFRLALLTGCRKGELLAARWEHVDRTRRVLRIPAPKNDEPRDVPLSPEAMAELDALPRMLGNPYILAGRQAGKPLQSVQKAWARICERAELDDLRVHDLRRTLGSMMAMNGASLALIGHALGHKSPRSTRVYARFQPDAAREAMEAHARQVMDALPVAGGGAA